MAIPLVAAYIQRMHSTMEEMFEACHGGTVEQIFEAKRKRKKAIRDLRNLTRRARRKGDDDVPSEQEGDVRE
jgi:hypothetical protein